MSCDVGKAAEGVENEALHHSPTLTSLHLRHSSFSNPSAALPTSQLIIQPFHCFTYVICTSPTSPGELPMLLWRCLIYPWWFSNLQWLRPAGLYERCKLALELKRLKTPDVKLEAWVQVPVQDRIYLFQFYIWPTDRLVLKTKFSSQSVLCGAAGDVDPFQHSNFVLFTDIT